jgi:hypothetical protein
MRRLTGCLPDRDSTREREQSEHNYGQAFAAAPASTGDIIQPIAWIRDQRDFPSCAGQSFAECIDAVTRKPPWASGVSIWREARRRQNQIEDIAEGTRLEYAVAGLVARGWDPYVEGEDSDKVEAGVGAPDAGDDLADEMFAYDKRDLSGKRYRIDGDRCALVDDALQRNLGVVIGSGLTESYFYIQNSPGQTERVYGGNYIGGDANGHAQRIFARSYWPGRRVYAIQNHWSIQWGGCRMPGGLWEPGCIWVEEDVISELAWDVYGFQVQP